MKCEGLKLLIENFKKYPSKVPRFQARGRLARDEHV